MDGPDSVNARLRQLPAVDLLIDAAGSGTSLPAWALRKAARSALDRVRGALLASGGVIPPQQELAAAVRIEAHELARPWPRRVLNATGVVLHTNLGRAPLSAEAAAAVAEAAVGYSDLELDVSSGRRGSRMKAVGELLCEATGAQDALVVNNNAAAVLLALDSLSPDREVILSRGELVEIGGSFRIPDVLNQSRARLREVGTTNRTHLRDYSDAIGPETGALLKVHRSNFEIRGFTLEVGLRELAPLAREHGLPLIEDRGSGTIVDLSRYGIPEPEVQRGLDDGADLVLFSGDKLLGGPQAGVIVGRAALIERLQKNALTRTFRPDKMTLAGLEATLRLYRDPHALVRKLPIYRMLSASPETLRETADQLARSLAGLMPNATMSCEADTSYAGGGSLPTLPFPTWVVRFRDPRLSSGELAHALRRRDLPIICRVQDDALVLDCRTLRGDDDEQIAAALAEVLREAGG